jgi:hypothetical protein
LKGIKLGLGKIQEGKVKEADDFFNELFYKLDIDQ